MSDKQLIIKTNWRYFKKQILLGVILSPLMIGLIMLFYVVIKLKKQTYIISDKSILDRDSGFRIDIDDITQTKITNRQSSSRITLYDLELISSNNRLILKGISNATEIKESIDQLIRYKNELKESELKRNAVQIKQDPGSLERLNDLAGLLQEGLISYEDYLQERKNFEDK